MSEWWSPDCRYFLARELDGIAVVVQWAVTGVYDKAELATTLTGLLAAFVTFLLDSQAEAHHFLMQRHKGNGAMRRAIPDEPMGVHGMHDWWYRCLAFAGIVPEGTTRGEKMHKARHSAGQRLLDHTGNLKAVQRLLGHESIQTTGDIYVDWDDERLASSLMDALKSEEAE